MTNDFQKTLLFELTEEEILSLLYSNDCDKDALLDICFILNFITTIKQGQKILYDLTHDPNGNL